MVHVDLSLLRMDQNDMSALIILKSLFELKQKYHTRQTSYVTNMRMIIYRTGISNVKYRGLFFCVRSVS